MCFGDTHRTVVGPRIFSFIQTFSATAGLQVFLHWRCVFSRILHVYQAGKMVLCLQAGEGPPFHVVDPQTTPLSLVVKKLADFSYSRECCRSFSSHHYSRSFLNAWRVVLHLQKDRRKKITIAMLSFGCRGICVKTGFHLLDRCHWLLRMFRIVTVSSL